MTRNLLAVLYASTDSSMAKVQNTGDDGSFSIINVNPGEYWIQVRYVGLPTLNGPVFRVEPSETLTLPTYTMSEQTAELAAVTVTAQRPILEIKPDKTVFNVQGSINSTGNNALELLRKAPGVVVDNNENLIVLGKSGVKIYIDGRPSPLVGEALTAYLKSLQASQIDNIEIITNPSAKYDAEGNAGIVNIRLVKDKRHGTNASLDLGYRVGEYASYNGSISGNHRTKKVNVFANYGFSDWKGFNDLNLRREQAGKFFDGNSTRIWDGQSHNLKLGLDFFPTKGHTIGVLFNGNVSNGSSESNSETPIGSIIAGVADSMLVASSTGDDVSTNSNINLNYQFERSKSESWNIDLDYGIYNSEDDEYQPNSYTDINGENVFSVFNFGNETATDIGIFTAKLDHERKLGKGKFETGLKTAFVTTDNVFDFFNYPSTTAIKDLDRSNAFTYTENVNAVYGKYSQEINKKWGYSIGLRVEQTNSEGDLESTQQNDDDNVKNTYVDFFPSGGLTYNPNRMNSFRLNYSRRVNRPNYQDLNPFESKIDELSFRKGNPFLEPEYAHSLQLTYTYAYRYSLTLAGAHTENVIARIVDTINTNASFISWENLAQRQTLSLSLAAPFTISKKLSSFVNLTYSAQRNQADDVLGKEIDVTVTSFNMYMQHSYKLPHDFTFELSGWYSSPSIWESTFKTKALGSVDLGLQKKLFDGKGKLKLSMNDIFYTSPWSGRSDFGGMVLSGTGAYDSRKFGINFSYLFGNQNVRSRKRKTGSESESNRIKSDN